MTVIVVCGSLVGLAVEVVLLAALIIAVTERKPALLARYHSSGRQTDRNGGYSR